MKAWVVGIQPGAIQSKSCHLATLPLVGTLRTLGDGHILVGTVKTKCGGIGRVIVKARSLTLSSVFVDEGAVLIRRSVDFSRQVVLTAPWVHDLNTAA